MKPAFRIRPAAATAEDAALLARIGRETFGETFGADYRPEDLAAFFAASHSPEAAAATLADPGSAAAFVETEAGCLGYGLVTPNGLPHADPARPTLELKRFYLLRALHGTGAADVLMDWALEEAARLGAADLALSVFSENRRAMRFYARHGFAEVGRYVFRVGEQEDDERVWVRPLDLDITRAAGLSVPHAFLGRAGGVSRGLFASLNVGLGSSDDPAAVRENRRRALGALPVAQRLLTVRQVHGRAVLTAERPLADDARPEADAMVTRSPGLALGVLTADCAPILFADDAAGVIGAAHAGWKGALGGVIEATVAAMEALGASRTAIKAAIGPTIAQPSYEVGGDFADRVPAMFLRPNPAGRLQFDLPGFCAQRLAEAGVCRVERVALDTYALDRRFFSYRRATHRGESDYGRQLSLIALP